MYFLTLDPSILDIAETVDPSILDIADNCVDFYST